MQYSRFTQKIAGDGAEAWDIHTRAVAMADAGADVILLSMGDPDFDTPPAIVEAAVTSLREGHTHYTGFTGEPALLKVIAAQHAEATGCDVTEENVVVLSGAQCALFCAMHCIVDAGDEVIVPEPAYVTYEAVVRATGAEMVGVPMLPEQHFRVSADTIRSAVTDKTRAILLNTPHNPTGAVISPQELQAIADIAIEHDLWVVSDEVYASLTYDQPHHSISGLAGMQERTIVINSVSKSHAMTGWRVGWTIGPKELSGHLANMSTCMLYGCPTFSQHAVVTALTAELDELDIMKQKYRARRDLVYRQLSQVPDLHCHLPEGGMFIMVDIRHSGCTAEEFATQLLDDYGVSVLAGDAFGASAAGHIRLGLIAELPVLEDACQRIERCFLSLRK
ncbi:pyridoxal phosphate-dependent aminotransferase [Aestuariicella hydrocarbonica]|uniref:Aminotransferase n=1 Tax=Pseudomaricurvus hydrocarbonicus TaxID=1470433 RepID=A0A9E5MKU4_9GAMM|nr:pyridoxal phosphate-dependent aminotransferase [Aestuariicella hydrocarbonica]NHO65842.1 pyridoxal phosphate-dependent aminotransferase [Aestuariicella hydrocarbonica]